MKKMLIVIALMSGMSIFGAEEPEFSRAEFYSVITQKPMPAADPLLIRFKRMLSLLAKQDRGEELTQEEAKELKTLGKVADWYPIGQRLK